MIIMRVNLVSNMLNAQAGAQNEGKRYTSGAEMAIGFAGNGNTAAPIGPTLRRAKVA